MAADELAAFRRKNADARLAGRKQLTNALHRWAQGRSTKVQGVLAVLGRVDLVFPQCGPGHLSLLSLTICEPRPKPPVCSASSVDRWHRQRAMQPHADAQAKQLRDRPRFCVLLSARRSYNYSTRVRMIGRKGDIRVRLEGQRCGGQHRLSHGEKRCLHPIIDGARRWCEHVPRASTGNGSAGGSSRISGSGGSNVGSSASLMVSRTFSAPLLGDMECLADVRDGVAGRESD